MQPLSPGVPGLLEREPELSINIRILGDEGVGKSSLLACFEGVEKRVYDGGPNPDVSKGLRLEDPERILPDVYLKVNIWDTPKWMRWDDSDVTVYPSLLEGIVVVFDLTNEQSWLNVKTKWLAWIERTKQEGGVDRLHKEVGLVLVGNKSDLAVGAQRVVSEKEVERLVRNPKSKFLDYFEVSSVTGDNVELAFQTLARHVVNKKKSKLKLTGGNLLDENYDNEEGEDDSGLRKMGNGFFYGTCGGGGGLCVLS